MRSVMSLPAHMPVLLKETIEALAIQPGGRYIDCTLGGGGHASAILEQSSPGGQLLGIDADPSAIHTAKDRLRDYSKSMLLVNDNFSNLKSICEQYDFHPVHGILFDLGLSSMQLDSEGHGFSFQHNAPLDMRFNPKQGTSAADIVNNYSEAELANLIRTYGEEKLSRQIARRIVQERPIDTTGQLAQIIEKAVGGKRGRIHPATRTFQALRISVNHELENLESALQQAVEILGYSGKLVVISYHSLEDRIVKQFMQKEAKDCICPPQIMKCICGHKASLKILTQKIIIPSEAEVKTNPRSRSARLRVAERISATPELQGCAYVHRRADIDSTTNPALLEKLQIAFLPLRIASAEPILWGG